MNRTATSAQVMAWDDMSSQEMQRFTGQIVATATAKKAPPEGVDITISMLESEIAERIISGSLYKELGKKFPEVAKSETFEKDNESHRQYILVLRKVLNALKQIRNNFSQAVSTAMRMARGRKQRKPRTANNKTPADSQTNVYHGLEIEEPRVEDLPDVIGEVTVDGTVEPLSIKPSGTLPEREPPTYLGLPANAEKLLLVGQAKEMCGNLGKVLRMLDEGEQIMAEAE